MTPAVPARAGRRTRRPVAAPAFPSALAVPTLAIAAALAVPAPGGGGITGGDGHLAAQEAPAAAAPPVDSARTAVLADSARVGDVVPVAVRIVVGPGEQVVWPDTLPLVSRDLENAASVRVRTDTLEDGRLQLTGVYAVTPWRTGELALPPVELPVVGPDEGVRRVAAAFPSFEVASVLPTDTTGIEPRPAKEVLGPNWAWEAILLAVFAILALAALLAWWLRRRARDRAAAPSAPAMSPRERALARLREARESGLLEAGELKPFYTGITQAVREYVAALDPDWGDDLTTTELLARLRADLGPSAAAGLADVLRPADRVKFARRRPDRPTAEAEWDTARKWVESFDGPPSEAAA